MLILYIIFELYFNFYMQFLNYTSSTLTEELRLAPFKSKSII